MPKVSLKKPVLKRGQKVEPPPPSPQVEAEPETNEESESEELPLEAPKLVRQSNKKQIVIPDESESESEEQEEVPAPKARGRPKKSSEPRKPSLWLEVLRENGFMVKGGSFKPTPKKGTPEYEAVRKAFDERKAALAQ